MKRFFIICLLFSQCCFAQHWQSLLLGTNNDIVSLFADSINNKLYAGGHFTQVNNTVMWGIASWNGNRWDSLRHGMDDSSYTNMPANTNSINRYGNYLYMGGSFLRAGNLPNTHYLARWDGSQWSAVPGGAPNNVVDDIIVYNNELYICGVFDSVGNVPASGIAKWNGTTWQSIGPNYDFCPPTIGYAVLKMAFYHGNLYAGGIFEDLSANICRLAKWNGVNWQFLTNNLQGGIADVDAMEVYNNKLYVAGLFFTSDGNVANSIISWDDTTWCAVGGSVQILTNQYPQINDMCIHNGKLYCVGNFEKIGGISAKGLASWDGTQWCGFNTNFDTYFHQMEGAYKIAFYNDTMYVAGGFQYADTVFTNFIAKWIGGNYVDTCGTISTGINQLTVTNSTFGVFPNPANENITINFNSPYTNNLQIKIIDVLGQTVIEKKEETISGSFEKQIDVSNLNAGVYMIMIRAGEKEFAQKLIIQR
jgi:hypothetical protein